jgi:hypothetical protein
MLEAPSRRAAESTARGTARRELNTEHQREHDRFEGRREPAGGGSGLVVCPGRLAKRAQTVVRALRGQCHLLGLILQDLLVSTTGRLGRI